MDLIDIDVTDLAEGAVSLGSFVARASPGIAVFVAFKIF